MHQRLIDLIGKRNPIFAGNIERVGLLRIIPAALAMYLLIPFFIFLHVVCLMLLYNTMICLLLGVEQVKLRNYIIIDRHKLTGLSYTGRFHCIYCGYANGICVAFGVLLTQISSVSGHEGEKRGLLPSITYFAAAFLTAMSMSIIVLMYNVVIATALGLHRLGMSQAYDKMDEGGFGNGFTIFGRAGYLSLRYQQALILVLANILEQIESQWCPIKHLDREGAVYPEHHKFFVERCELCELKRILSCEGSVSPRKPKY
ncbi:hypothetical protein [Mariprofundus ferrinatatus]|uniref:hypothetical protein n=1 Tax=Mariprofundus ferrinatatus TaxID=1921087 RepID=UPI0012FF4EEE|nr:hypothetical protein [Mariprofundus ferrinatatus]